MKKPLPAEKLPLKKQLFVKSISLCFLALAILGTGCAHKVKIPNVTIYKEIPFVDGAEGAYYETLTKKKGILTPEEWEAKRPFLLSIDPEGWYAIRGQWYEACRPAGDDCNVVVRTIDDAIRKMDDLARGLLGKP